MSRVSSLSQPALAALFSPESTDQLIMLVEITPKTYTGIPGEKLYLADGYTGRLEGPGYTTDAEVIYGVTSNSNKYIYIPMEITLPKEEDSGLASCQIKFNYTTPEMIAIIREELQGPSDVDIKLILASHPDLVEASFPGFYLTGATYNKEGITLDLNTIPLTREPFPCYYFTPSLFPGLF